LRSKTKSNIFQWLYLVPYSTTQASGISRTPACYGYLTSNQNVLINTTHIKKVIA